MQAVCILSDLGIGDRNFKYGLSRFVAKLGWRVECELSEGVSNLGGFYGV